MSANWKHKDLWKLEGLNYVVEVSRHSVDLREESGCYDAEGPHRWCVYAYIYPKHPLFSRFDQSKGMWEQPDLGFHGGTSLFQPNYKDDGVICSFKVGGDYNHLHDWMFTQMATKDDARTVFQDAEEIAAHLQATEAQPCQSS